MIRTYSVLRTLTSLEEKFDYLELGGVVGDVTFGSERWVNQHFYHSREWRQVRDHVIVRDKGLDLGTHDTPIRGAPRIHHLNPLTLNDIEDATENLLDPEFLISTALRTHNAIHYGDKRQLPRPFVERSRGDHIEW